MKKQLGKLAPKAIKIGYRLFRYRNEWNKFCREFGIRKKQNQLLKELYLVAQEKLIVFIVPGSDWATGNDKITGGTISIVSLCEETAALKEIHGAQTIMCTINGEHLLLKHSMFSNKTTVYRFEQLADFFIGTRSVLFHVPELLVDWFLQSLTPKDKKWFRKMTEVHVNIMNQNIRLMPPPSILGKLKQYVNKLTITTAHQKYCTSYYRDYYGVPVHKFSVWISPEQYHYKQWHDKKNLMVVSPDQHPLKEAILSELQAMGTLEIQIVQNLTYTQYKELIADAKWSLTFGEGLDGYFIEPVFSGAVSFAIYNEDFFTKDFEQLETVYPSVTKLQSQISIAMKALDHKNIFLAYQQQQFDLCASHYSMEQYRKNIAAFYKNEFTFA